MLDPFDMEESMDLVEFLETNKSTRTIQVGGLHKKFLEWDRDKQNDYLTSLFNRTKKAGRWILMDTGGISEKFSKEIYDFLIERLKELSKI